MPALRRGVIDGKSCSFGFIHPPCFPALLSPRRRLPVLSQLTGHLERQIAQVKPLVGFRPGVEPGFRLLHQAGLRVGPGRPPYSPKANTLGDT